MLKELDTREYEGRRIVKTLEELHPYISVYTNNKGSRLPLDTLKARGYSIIWRLE
jgi:hypothetical protein